MFGLFGAGTLTITAQLNSAGIVLLEDHLFDVDPLCQHEVACPDELWHHIIDTNQLSVCGAS